MGAICNEPLRVPCVCLCERESGICTIAAGTVAAVYPRIYIRDQQNLGDFTEEALKEIIKQTGK
ncbi:MAG: hypothetical protein CVV64_20535 [Candidatus Wallbacteria bacterium HGW-Wallbacteria-1]|uniref:Uncharacterized protein n=1 Tax=Candidatus Wallbacteria bacterium HGW-Wallbacteria-1 TaxID=2013854 RepID=A0A2N1PI71_9BACT|nr:MAG: hypothetical protein CVV64_20535 [Candidatus Wallbacteria bacterium HGW-Wallbacteria-1]